MKTNRTRTVTAAVLGITLLSLAPLSAQARGGRHGDGPDPVRAVERLTVELGLSGEQEDEVQAIMEESFANRRELRDRHRGERDAARDATEEQLAAVLTGEQMEELRELWEERRERRQDCDRRGGPKGRSGRGED